jgi:CRP-like cAMP-binding protein
MSSQKDPRPFKENSILSRLPRQEHERLRALLEPVRLPRGRVLFEAGEAVRYVYFITGGMASLLALTSAGETVQVAMVGAEGAVGIPALLGVSFTPYRALVQLQATALRVGMTALVREFGRCDYMHALLLRYLHTLLTQITQSALCNRYHTIEERLCRWLLISHDRGRSDLLELTQESLAHMLGAQRTGVTAAAASLQRAGLINYRHGKIRLLDMPGMQGRSCECYRVITREVEHYLAA